MPQRATMRIYALGMLAALVACSSSQGAARLPHDGPPPGLPAARPPSRGSAKAAGEERWFVLSKLQFGGTDRATGESDPNAWRQYGFDLDRITTTAEDSATSARSCRRRSGSPLRVLEDGWDGRDDNFAHYLTPLASSFTGEDVEARANAALARGAGPTLLIHLWNVGSDDNGSVPGEIYGAASLAHEPSYDESDHFPIDDRSIADGKALAQFPRGYMAGGVWVSGDGDDQFVIRLPFAFEGYPLELRLTGFVSFDVHDISGGTIAGALTLFDLEKAAGPSLEAAGLCPGQDLREQVLQTLEQNVDLVAGNASFQNTGIECNAVSVGLGFEIHATGVPAPPTHALAFESRCP